MKRSAAIRIPPKEGDWIEQPARKQSRPDKAVQSGCLYLNKLEILPDEFNERAFSLKEVIETVRPIASLHLNFMIDIDWLIKQYPAEISESPITLVVGSKMGSEYNWLLNEVRKRKLENVTVGKASLPIPFGTHHTKLTIFESDDSLHVLISTANLLQSDWETKTQLFYYAKGDLKSEEVTEGSLLSRDLYSYLTHYNIPELNYWKERLKFASFVENGDRIVYSVPGYHTGAVKNEVGHLRLRAILAEREREDPQREGKKLLVCQASSIGSLGAKPEQWLTAQFLQSLQGGKNKRDRLLVVYPTEENVRQSMVGLAAGSSLPYSRSTAEKQPWLRDKMCRWRSEWLGRSRAMPHVKSYAEFDSEKKELQWMVVTSANLSKAAWGVEQKNGTQLMIRSYELGILLQDQSRLLLPYDYPLSAYKMDDVPWYVEVLQESLR